MALLRRPIGWAGCALFAYLVIGLLLFSGVWRSPTEIAVGNRLDTPLVVWLLRWVPFALSHGYSPLTTDYLDSPALVNLMWNPSHLLVGFVLSPLSLFVHPVLTVNVLGVLAPALNAWCALLAIRRYIRHPLAAAAGGFVYGFSPFVMAHSLGHPQLAVACLPPLMLIVLDEILVRQRWPAVQAGAVLGSLGVAQLLIGEEMLAIFAIVAALAVPLLALLNRDVVTARLPHAAGALAVAAASFVLLAAYPLGVQLLGPQPASSGFQPTIFYASDLANFVVPTRLQLLAPASDLSEKFRGGITEDAAYLGFPFLALAWYMLRHAWSSRLVRWVLLLTPMVALLSMGHRLHVFGAISGLFLPWELFARLPLLGHILPARIMVYAFLLAGILLALFLDSALAALQRPQQAFGLIVAGLVVLTLTPRPLPVVPVQIPSFFTAGEVSRIPPGSVALVAPFAGATSSDAMAWQAAAAMRFRIPEGYVYGPTWLNPPPSTLQSAMLNIQQGRDARVALVGAGDSLLEDLRRMNIRTVLVGPMAHRDAMVAFLTSLLGREPSTSGDVQVWWDIAP